MPYYDPVVELKFPCQSLIRYRPVPYICPLSYTIKFAWYLSTVPLLPNTNVNRIYEELITWDYTSKMGIPVCPL